MLFQGYTPLTTFQLAEEFFVSMNMSAMPPDFWALSVFEQPPDRHLHCQPSAWDFCNGHDYRYNFVYSLCYDMGVSEKKPCPTQKWHINRLMTLTKKLKYFINNILR